MIKKKRRYAWAERQGDDLRLSSFVMKYILPGTITLILGALIGFYPEITAAGQQKLLLWLIATLCCLMLLMVFVYTAVLRLITIEEQRNLHRVTSSKDYPHLKFGRSTAFDYCSAVAKQAKKSIYVVGPHFADGLSEVPGTDSHSTYLEEHMSVAIDRHADGLSDASFEYFRILQLDPGQADRTVPETGHVEHAAVGNSPLADHIEAVLRRNMNSEFVNVDIFARDYVPSLPSILVIDEQYVFFSLPTFLTRNPDGDAKALNGKGLDNRPTLNYDFVLEIEDKSGEIPRQFKRLIRQLRIGAYKVEQIVRSESVEA